MTRLHVLNDIFEMLRRASTGIMLTTIVVSTGCTTNYLTNSTEGTYGVPMTERTIPQRLLDRSIEHTVKINVYGLQENLQQNSRISIDSFNSEVLLSGEVPSELLKTEIEKVVASMPDVRRVYNELNVSASKGYSATVQDGYITSKLLAKIAASNGVKASQIKAVTNNGVVYIMGRMTPTQQSHIIDIANSTVGITELVLLTTVVNDRGMPISDDDIMFEQKVADTATTLAATPIIRNMGPTASSNISTPIVVTEDGEIIEQGSSSPYIDLYQDQQSNTP